MKTTVTMAVMAVLFACVAAMASTTGTVDLTLTYNQDSGLYLLQVQASAGDNAGIASYGVRLTGHDTLVNVGPYVEGWNKDYTRVLRDGFVWRGINCVGDLELAGTQNTIHDGVNLIYGFGQTAGDLTPPEGWPAVPEHEELQAVYEAPLLLAHGTFTGGAPTCEYAEFNLFDVIGDEQPSLAQTVLHVVDNPALLAGNVDLDNDVDIFDWAIFQTNYGRQAAMWTGGDFDFDGDVDIFDFAIFQG
ncbi:MAG: hypothetical protein HQ546_00960, partial [Planctomycetes bacterium]|nr:hypothetical protein [Planctomycetota bacterium]